MRSNRASVWLIVHPTALNANKPELQRSQVQLDYSRGSYPLLHLAKTQHSDFEHFTSRRNSQLSVEIHPSFNGFLCFSLSLVSNTNATSWPGDTPSKITLSASTLVPRDSWHLWKTW